MLIAPEEPEVETIRVPVLRVFDGDGFLTRITGRGNLQVEAAVRFGFIDAPEIDQPGGREAKDFLSDLISGRWLDLVILTKMDTGQIFDRHRRIVAVPYLRQSTAGHPSSSGSGLGELSSLSSARTATRNVELEMVLNGWAWVLDRYGPEERYYEALEHAQRHRRGIWAWSDNIHPWEFKKRKYLKRTRRRCDQPEQPELSLGRQPPTSCPAPGCRGHIVKRSGRFGAFYGCSTFPDCRYSRSTIE